MNKFTEKSILEIAQTPLQARKVGIYGYTVERTSQGFWVNSKIQLEGGYEVPVVVLVNLLNRLKETTQEGGEVVVTTNEGGECILVSRQDEDHNILKVIWEKK